MKSLFLTLALLTTLGLCSLSASVTGISSTEGVTFNDNISWSQFGPDYTDIATDAPFSTNLGLSGSLNNLFTLQVLSESTSGLDFGPGTVVESFGCPINMVFNSPIRAFGVSVESEYFGDFTSVVTAFDSSHNVLGSFTEGGSSSVIFLGLVSDAFDIASIEISVPTEAVSHDRFAISNVSASTAVPEPSTYVSILSGLGVIGAMTRFRRRNA